MRDQINHEINHLRRDLDALASQLREAQDVAAWHESPPASPRGVRRSELLIITTLGTIAAIGLIAFGLIHSL